MSKEANTGENGVKEVAPTEAAPTFDPPDRTATKEKVEETGTREEEQEEVLSKGKGKGKIQTVAEDEVLQEKEPVLDDSEMGEWQYICVDPGGVRLRTEPIYVKQQKAGVNIAFGEVVQICERGRIDQIMWLRLDDDRGWAFERTNRQRMSEVLYVPTGEDGNLIVRPDMNTGVRLMDQPYHNEKAPYITMLHCGTPVAVQCRAKITCQDGPRFFMRIHDDVENEGWIPEKLDGKPTLCPFTIEQIAMEGVPSLWVSINPGKSVPIYLAPGRSDQPMGTCSKCEILEVAPERLTCQGLTFYRLVVGGWLCETNIDGKVQFQWVQREPHWWIYSVSGKGGADIRHVPTREKKLNTGKELKQGTEVPVSERVAFGNGDAFLRLEPPHQGWVPVLRQNGDVKMQAEREVPSGTPYNLEAELPPFLKGEGASPKGKKGYGTLKILRAFGGKTKTKPQYYKASATE